MIVIIQPWTSIVYSVRKYGISEPGLFGILRVIKHPTNFFFHFGNILWDLYRFAILEMVSNCHCCNFWVGIVHPTIKDGQLVWCTENRVSNASSFCPIDSHFLGYCRERMSSDQLVSKILKNTEIFTNPYNFVTSRKILQQCT